MIGEGVSSALVAVAVVGYCVTCPYNKVEESFNTQAVHDVWSGLKVEDWDHLEFPGTVPRTFSGAVVVAWTARVFEVVLGVPGWLTAFDGAPNECDFFRGNLNRQVLARLSLGAWWVVGFERFARAVSRQFGPGAAVWFRVLTAAQFHQPFYATRLLANSMALVPCLFAYGMGLDGYQNAALAMLTATTGILRCDVVVLLAPLGLSWLVDGSSSARAFVSRLVAAGSWCLAALFAALAVTVPLDTYLWRRETWLWPEFAVLAYNNPVDNRSSAWGVMSRFWYAKALARALGFQLGLVVVGLYFESRRLLPLVGPAVFSIGLLSVLPHKELRFVFPALPLLTLAAAVGADRLARPKKDEKKEPTTRTKKKTLPSPRLPRRARTHRPRAVLGLALHLRPRRPTKLPGRRRVENRAGSLLRPRSRRRPPPRRRRRRRLGRLALRSGVSKLAFRQNRKRPRSRLLRPYPP